MRSPLVPGSCGLGHFLQHIRILLQISQRAACGHSPAAGAQAARPPAGAGPQAEKSKRREREASRVVSQKTCPRDAVSRGRGLQMLPEGLGAGQAARSALQDLATGGMCLAVAWGEGKGRGKGSRGGAGAGVQCVLRWPRSPFSELWAPADARPTRSQRRGHLPGRTGPAL